MNKILQLIPADGWSAVFADVEAGELKLYTERLACWALLEHGDHQYVTGYGGAEHLSACDECENFIGWLHDSDPAGEEQYREETEEWFRRRGLLEGAA